MIYKGIGAALIILSCAGFGMSIAVHRIQEIRYLSVLSRIMENMVSELSFRVTPLPELAHHASEGNPKILERTFLLFEENLRRQILPDATSCMESAIQEMDMPYSYVAGVLHALGQSVGRFDLAGQINGLKSVQEMCRQNLAHLRDNHENQVRSYRVLGICTGVALAILLI